MKIWLDDIRRPPEGYKWCVSVNQVKRLITQCEQDNIDITVIDCDHDLGEYFYDGGDGIRLLDWLEETGRNYRIELHTMNPVGKANMLRIINKNNWR